VTLRTAQSGISPTKKKPPIAEELEKLREMGPRTSNREPLSRLEKLAILDGLKDGVGPTRIASLWGISKRTVREFKSKLYDNPLNLFHYNVIDHRGKGMYQFVFCGESKPREGPAARAISPQVNSLPPPGTLDGKDPLKGLGGKTRAGAGGSLH